MKFTPVNKTVDTTNDHEWLDVHNGISNDIWRRDLVVKIFGITVYKYNRTLTSKSKIMDRDGKPLGFIEPK